MRARRRSYPLVCATVEGTPTRGVGDRLWKVYLSVQPSKERRPEALEIGRRNRDCIAKFRSWEQSLHRRDRTYPLRKEPVDLPVWHHTANAIELCRGSAERLHESASQSKIVESTARYWFKTLNGSNCTGPCPSVTWCW